MLSGGRCSACKYLRRRCPSDCIFSPYFPSNNPQRFAFVHRIYGASIASKLLSQLPVHLRAKAADSLYFEAYCRIQDPVYGCVKIISELQQQIHDIQSQLAQIKAQIVCVNAQDIVQEPHFQQINQDGSSHYNNNLYIDQDHIEYSLYGRSDQDTSLA